MVTIINIEILKHIYYWIEVCKHNVYIINFENIDRKCSVPRY